MPIPKYYFHYDSEKPQITRRYALIGQSVPDESGGPGLLAWTLFHFSQLPLEFESHCLWGLHPRNESRVGVV